MKQIWRFGGIFALFLVVQAWHLAVNHRGLYCPGWACFLCPVAERASRRGRCEMLLIRTPRKKNPVCLGMLDMFLANVVSTVVEISLALPGLGMMLFLMLLPVMASVFAPTRRFAVLLLGIQEKKAFTLLIPVMGGMILSGFLFFAAHKSLDTNAHEIYWVLKIAYIAVAFLISIGVTTIYEEWIISRIHKPQEGKPHYFMSVFSANLMTFLLRAGSRRCICSPSVWPHEFPGGGAEISGGSGCVIWFTLDSRLRGNDRVDRR